MGMSQQLKTPILVGAFSVWHRVAFCRGSLAIAAKRFHTPAYHQNSAASRCHLPAGSGSTLSMPRGMEGQQQGKVRHHRHIAAASSSTRDNAQYASALWHNLTVLFCYLPGRLSHSEYLLSCVADQLLIKSKQVPPPSTRYSPLSFCDTYCRIGA